MNLPVGVLVCGLLAASSAAAQDGIPKEVRESFRNFKKNAPAQRMDGPSRGGAAALRPSPDDLLIRDSDTFVPPETITAAQLGEDLDLLDDALRRGYGGRKFVDQGVFAAALDKIAALKLSVRGPIRTAELCRRLTDILWPIPDRHLMVGAVGRMDMGTVVRLVKEDVARVGGNFSKQTSRPWDIGFVEAGGRRVPVVAITSFPPPQDARWEGFIEAARVAVMGASAVILDVRGNTGGNNAKGLEFARLLYGQELPMTEKQRVYSQTPETLALAANSPKLSIKRMQGKGQAVPDFYPKALAESLALYESSKGGGVPGERIETYDAGRGLEPAKMFPGLIYVLGDRGTASSGESMVWTFLSHPRAKFVGENTAGALNFGNLGYVVLHNSQLYVGLATDYWIHLNGHQDWEKTGIPPQVPVAAGQDALEVAEQLLARDLGR